MAWKPSDKEALKNSLMKFYQVRNPNKDAAKLEIDIIVDALEAIDATADLQDQHDEYNKLKTVLNDTFHLGLPFDMVAPARITQPTQDTEIELLKVMEALILNQLVRQNNVSTSELEAASTAAACDQNFNSIIRGAFKSYDPYTTEIVDRGFKLSWNLLRRQTPKGLKDDFAAQRFKVVKFFNVDTEKQDLTEAEGGDGDSKANISTTQKPKLRREASLLAGYRNKPEPSPKPEPASTPKAGAGLRPKFKPGDFGGANKSSASNQDTEDKES